MKDYGNILDKKKKGETATMPLHIEICHHFIGLTEVGR